MATTKNRTTRITSATSTRTPGVLGSKDAASYLGVAHGTLAKWRCLGGGPRYAKLGSRVAYRIADLEEFVESRLIA